jgi:hypothetical protein
MPTFQEVLTAARELSAADRPSSTKDARRPPLGRKSEPVPGARRGWMIELRITEGAEEDYTASF